MATDGDTSKLIYNIPNQHLYKGVVYLDVQPHDSLQKIPDLELSAEDIIVVTYPKCGTTWMCEVADVVHHDGETMRAARDIINRRWPMLETAIPGRFNNLETIESSRSPRQIKTHMDVTFLSKQVREQGVKTILVLRNPKDCLVSFYHFYRMFSHYHNFPGTWEEFFEIFKAGQLNYGDPIDHMLGWWALRDLPNVEVFMYEDMLKDSPATVRRLGQFLGKKFTDAQVEDIVNYTSFDSMKKHATTNHGSSAAFKQTISPFYRKGQVGDWKNYFTDEQNRYIDEVMQKKLAGTGLTFAFE